MHAIVIKSISTMLNTSNKVHSILNSKSSNIYCTLHIEAREPVLSHRRIGMNQGGPWTNSLIQEMCFITVF